MGGSLPHTARLDVPVRPITDDEAARVHSPAYLSSLRRALGKGSGWGHIDADTYFCPDTEQAAWLAAGGGVELCRALMEGKSRRGIALLRPPGHHACPSQSMGFCLLNNVAIAAADALARGASRVAVIDWDVHHGNGTQDIFYAEPRVLFISLHQSPLYPGTGRIDEIGRGEAQGYNINVPVPPRTGPAAYGEAFRSIVLPILSEFRADVVLVSAGLDAHVLDLLAELDLDASCYGALTTALVTHAEEMGHGRVGLFLEGGYDLSAIADSFSAMTRALQGRGTALPNGPLRSAESSALAAARHVAEQYWPI